ncbi:MAG: T9SS type A sorting domain-containing protein, partial [Ekhidna sp.]|nr:T9SS type A sorting domain-containing protein [Ekhidna sp.]
TATNCAGNTITAAPDVTFPITTSTTITWTYTDGSNTATQTQEVTIDDTEAPTVTGTLDAITARCSLAEADVTAPKANDVCDGQITATTNATFPITSKTTITWTYTDKTGNTTTQTQAVTITPCVLSAAGDAMEAVVFPNPSSGRYVEVRSPVNSPIRILSVGGELMMESTTNTKIDAASLQSGLYLVQLPDGRLLKFVKK